MPVILELSYFQFCLPEIEIGPFFIRFPSSDTVYEYVIGALKSTHGVYIRMFSVIVFCCAEANPMLAHAIINNSSFFMIKIFVEIDLLQIYPKIYV